MDVVIDKGKRYRLFGECQSQSEADTGATNMRKLTRNEGWRALEHNGQWGIYLRLRD